MRVSELIERLKEVPQEAYVYLDDTKMPTCLGIADIQVDRNVGFIVETKEQIEIITVTLSTYKYDHLVQTEKN